MSKETQPVHQQPQRGRPWRFTLLFSILFSSAVSLASSGPTAQDAAAAVLATATPTVASKSVTFRPVADTYVTSLTPERNFGTAAVLKADSDPHGEAYLRFDVKGITGAVVRAKLRLYGQDASKVGGSVSLMSDSSWSETGVTYANRPAIDGAELGSIGRVTPEPQWYEVDVTAAIAPLAQNGGAGAVSFGLRSSNQDGVGYASREQTNQPRLIVTYAAPAPVATATAPATATSVAKQLATATATSVATSTATASPTATATAVATNTPAPTATSAATATATVSATTTAIATATGTTDQSVEPLGLALTSTFESVGVEVRFRGDGNANAQAALAFRKTADGAAAAWREALPLWRTDDGSAATGGPGAAFYGSALLLDPGTDYELRVSFSDPDGVRGVPVLLGKARTRAENIAAAESLAPTHYVSPAGNDSATGTSPTAPWRTLEKAMRAAPTGAVVRLAPGHYAPPGATTVRTQPLTIVAEYPAVDANRAPINEGKRSVVEPLAISSPAGSGGPNAGVWQQVTLAGPGFGGAPLGATYTVWKWAGSPVREATQLGVATTRDALPERVAHWAQIGTDLATPAGWAEKLYTNGTYNYGFYSNGNDIYLRMPSGANPNTLYVTAGEGQAFAVDGTGVRFSGLEIRQFEYGVEYRANATFGVVDRSLLTGNFIGVRFVGKQGPTPGSTSTYGSDHVVQENLIRDSSLWSDDASKPSVPWVFVKHYVANADGSIYQSATSKIGRWSETVGISARGGARRVVVRRNTVEGTFDAVGGYHEGFDRYSMQDADVHDNVFRKLADDGLDIARGTVNYRVWGNRIEQSLVVLSTGPTDYGPLFFFRNEAWRTGTAGVARSKDGRGPDATIFKYSGKSIPTARVWVLHNTLWTDETSPLAVNGGAEYANPGNFEESYYLRNNVIRGTKYAYSATGNAGKWDEDHNDFSTSDGDRGLSYGGRAYDGRATRTVADYRAASGNGARTNVRAEFDVVSDGELGGAASGNLALKDGSAFVDAGTPVANVSDLPGVNYSGSAPDLGARERA